VQARDEIGDGDINHARRDDAERRLGSSRAAG
jgi:hypothetical protein